MTMPDTLRKGLQDIGQVQVHAGLLGAVDLIEDAAVSEVSRLGLIPGPKYFIDGEQLDRGQILAMRSQNGLV